jgi:hypothetical protein
MADLNKLFVYKLHTTLTRYLQKLDLGFYKKIESQFGDEKTRTRTSGVANSRPDVEHREVHSRVHLLERVSENGVEDVVYPGTTAELLCRDLGRGTVNRGNERGGEPGHQLQDERASVLFTGESYVAVACQLLLRLSHERVEASLDVW